MTVDEIRELINLAAETGIAELEVQRGDARVRIRRAGFANPQEIVLAPPAYAAAPSVVGAPAAAAPSPIPVAPVPIPAIESTKQREDAKAVPDANITLVKSPIVGTFYESPSPDAPAFVSVGDRVQPGKVLCIIESMKLMNEIEAECSGVIERKLVLNGQPVEYGEALFAIRTV
jgi:acetyl-CoA carboxylase biotin carboxyl carrier protein